MYEKSQPYEQCQDSSVEVNFLMNLICSFLRKPVKLLLGDLSVSWSSG